MVYAFIITVLAGLLLLFLLGGGFVFVRRVSRAAAEGRRPFGRWRWHPSPLGLLILLPLAGLLLFRFFPLVLLLPIVLPFFRRGRGARRPTFFLWNAGRRPPRQNRGQEGNEGEIEGEYRVLDDA